MRRKVLKVSEGSGGWATVDEGLNAAEKEVTHGAERLQDGQTISLS